MLAIGLQDEIAQPVLRRRIGHRTQQRKTPPLAVHRILPRWKRDVPAIAAAPLPYGEPDEFQTLENAIFEVIPQRGFGIIEREEEFAQRATRWVWR